MLKSNDSATSSRSHGLRLKIFPTRGASAISSRRMARTRLTLTPERIGQVYAQNQKEHDVRLISAEVC